MTADFHELIRTAQNYLTTGELAQASESCRQAIGVQPGNPDAHYLLGAIAARRGDVAKAAACFRETISLASQYVPAHVALGNLLFSQNDLQGAADHYRQALSIREDSDARFMFGVVLNKMGYPGKAVEQYAKLEATDPGFPGLQNNLGLALVNLDRADEAVDCYKKEIALRPGIAAPYYNLGQAFSRLWDMDRAIHFCREALKIKPDYLSAHSSLLHFMNYVEAEQNAIYAEALRFGAQQTQGLATQRSFANLRDKSRKLRLGYVSGDFKSHSVAHFALPLLEAHDRRQFEIFCYSNGAGHDDYTERFRATADHWVPIATMTDDEVAARVRRDEIDILVDLSGHTSGNRILVFARRSAPIQLSWLGYPNTTGIGEMDYRITDPVADLSGAADDRHTEQLIRLPSGFLCYRNDERSPPVSPAPELERGHVTFGSFNMLAKVSLQAVDTWSDVLQSVPHSRLMLKAPELTRAQNRSAVLAKFAERQISADRIELLGFLPRKEDHLQQYSQVDIALDPFPYNGTTTTCEALWMGVPVITLKGHRHAGRVGASILHQVGLPEHIACDRESYVSLARALAENAEGRHRLRESLRARMQSSPLMNAPAFAVEIEGAYRSMWSDWCDTHQ